MNFSNSHPGATSVERPLWRSATLAFVLYLLASLVLIGHGTFAHFGSTAVGYGPDPPVTIWVLKWWPQAIVDGLNLLHTSVVYAPSGFNMTLTSPLAAPSLALAPVTQLAGPLVSYNVLSILVPAVNGWAAFLLCHSLCRRYWPSFVGGWMFGFSTYVLGQSLGHPQLSLVAMVPLAVYLIVRHLSGETSQKRFVISFTTVLIFQFLTSTEIFLTMTMIGLATWVLALLILRENRRGLLNTSKLIVLAYILTGILVSPYLLSMFTASQTLSHINPLYYSADPLNLVIPTRLTLGGSSLHAISERFTGNLSENGTYIGIPLLIVLALFAWRGWRDRTTVMVLGAFIIAVIAALGPRLNVLGTLTAVRLPWTPFIHLPIFKYVLPERMMAYAWLALSVAVALWLSSATRRRWARWALVGVGLVAILPDPGAIDPSPPHYGASIWDSRRPIPAFFSSGNRPAFRGRPNLLVLPYNEAGLGNNLYWQASTGMAYSMPGGYVAGTVPNDFACWPIVTRLRTEDYRRADRREFLAFLAAKQASGVVAPLAVAHSAAPLLDALPQPPLRTGGVVIYRISPHHESKPCPLVRAPE